MGEPQSHGLLCLIAACTCQSALKGNKLNTNKQKQIKRGQASVVQKGGVAYKPLRCFKYPLYNAQEQWKQVFDQQNVTCHALAPITPLVKQR